MSRDIVLPLFYLRQLQRSPAKRRVVFDKGGGEEGAQDEKPHAVLGGVATTVEEGSKRGRQGVEGDESSCPTTVEPSPTASLIDSSTSTTDSSTSGTEESAVATTLPPLDASTSTEQQGESGETPDNIDNPAAEKESALTVVVPSPEAANGDLAASSISSGVANGDPPVDTPKGAEVVVAGKGAFEQVPKKDLIQAAAATVTATEAFPLGNGINGDGDALMEDATNLDASAGADAAAPSDCNLTSNPSQGEVIASGGVAAALSAAAAVTSPAPVLAAVKDGEGAKVVNLDSTAEAAAAAETKAAEEAAAEETAAGTAQTEAAAEADKAAATATRQKAKADDKRAKRECEEACLRLLKMRGDVVVRTRGWSIEQLLALRGGTLELGAAICGRGMPRAKVGSAARAVDILMRYVDQRLP